MLVGCSRQCIASIVLVESLTHTAGMAWPRWSMQFVKHSNFSSCISFPSRVITSALVRCDPYVRLAYAKCWRCHLKRQGQIVTWRSWIGRTWLVETSQAHYSIWNAFERNKRGHEETWSPFYFELPRQSGLSSLCYWHTMSKISSDLQASRYICQFLVSGTRAGSSPRSPCGSRHKREEIPPW